MKLIKITPITKLLCLMGEINQKQTRPHDKPVPVIELSENSKKVIKKYYPYLFQAGTDRK